MHGQMQGTKCSLAPVINSHSFRIPGSTIPGRGRNRKITSGPGTAVIQTLYYTLHRTAIVIIAGHRNLQRLINLSGSVRIIIDAYSFIRGTTIRHNLRSKNYRTGSIDIERMSGSIYDTHSMTDLGAARATVLYRNSTATTNIDIHVTRVLRIKYDTGQSVGHKITTWRNAILGHGDAGVGIGSSPHIV